MTRRDAAAGFSRRTVTAAGAVAALTERGGVAIAQVAPNPPPSPVAGVPSMIKAIHHFACVVENLDASVAWYRDNLSFDIERRFGFHSAGVQIAHILHPAGIRIELIQQNGSAASPDLGLDAFGALRTQGAKHIGLLVEHIEEFADAMKAKGVEIVHDVTAVEPAGVKNFWIRDNSGNLIEFNQWLA